MRLSAVPAVLMVGFLLFQASPTFSGFRKPKVIVIPLCGEETHVPVEPGPAAPVPKTGQSTSEAAGDDADRAQGAAWPAPRFTDNTDGTVTDHLTGLVWMKNAACFEQTDWATALTDCNTLNNGECGLTDDSEEGNWRLPNVNELFSLIHHGFHSPAVPNTAGTAVCTEGDPFNNVGWGWYWTSTYNASNSDHAWQIYFRHGHIQQDTTDTAHAVWCVRDDR